MIFKLFVNGALQRFNLDFFLPVVNKGIKKEICVKSFYDSEHFFKFTTWEAVNLSNMYFGFRCQSNAMFFGSRCMLDFQWLWDQKTCRVRFRNFFVSMMPKKINFRFEPSIRHSKKRPPLLSKKQWIRNPFWSFLLFLQLLGSFQPSFLSINKRNGIVCCPGNYCTIPKSIELTKKAIERSWQQKQLNGLWKNVRWAIQFFTLIWCLLVLNWTCSTDLQ